MNRLAFLLLTLLPGLASAEGLLPENFGDPENQTYAYVLYSLKHLGNVAIQIVFAVALVFLILTGYRMITSLGNDKAVQQSKMSILYIIIGILVVIGAYVIVNTLGQQILR
ncbi:hypothetical protein HY375_01575 [Candidatus Berkelbacteria bacterium]|nr:hypothetical protein [Candidatus Berkelbacteria bacterium]